MISAVQGRMKYALHGKKYCETTLESHCLLIIEDSINDDYGVWRFTLIRIVNAYDLIQHTILLD
jgi:hypothetical protein